MSRIVIIGAGFAGLASAALLARDGHDVTVLERSAHIGGRVGSFKRQKFHFDTGPSWFLMPEVFDHYYRMLGSSIDEQLTLITLDPACRLYLENEEPIDVAADLDENLELFDAVEERAGTRLDRLLASSRRTYELARERLFYAPPADARKLAMSELFLRAGALGLRYLEPLGSLFGRTVADYRLRQILGYPAMFVGVAPQSAPGTFHLCAHLELGGGVLYPIGGFARIVETVSAFANAEGARVQTHADVTRILVDEGRAAGVEYRDAKGDMKIIEADVVISAMDLHHTETALLDESDRSYPDEYWSRAEPGAGALMIHLGVTGELPELEHHTVFLARDWENDYRSVFEAAPSESGALSFHVSKPSGVDADVAPEGFEAITVHVPIPAEVSLGHGGTSGHGDAAVEELADRVIAQIVLWAGIPDLAQRIVVRRTVAPADFADEFNSWNGAALGAAHTVKKNPFLRPTNASKKVVGLYYVGGSTSAGPGLPMSLIGAELLVKELRSDESVEPLSEPLVATVHQADAELLADATPQGR